MNVFCAKCGNEYDWNSEDIFNIRYEGSKEYICRNCLKIGKGFKNRKYTLRK